MFVGRFLQGSPLADGNSQALSQRLPSKVKYICKSPLVQDLRDWWKEKVFGVVDPRWPIVSHGSDEADEVMPEGSVSPKWRRRDFSVSWSWVVEAVETTFLWLSNCHDVLIANLKWSRRLWHRFFGRHRGLTFTQSMLLEINFWSGRLPSLTISDIDILTFLCKASVYVFKKLQLSLVEVNQA